MMYEMQCMRRNVLHTIFHSFTGYNARTTEIENNLEDASQASDQSLTIRQSRTMFAVSNRAGAITKSPRGEENQTGSPR